MGEILKLIIVFYELAKKYAREIGGGKKNVYTDDGDGNITISEVEV